MLTMLTVEQRERLLAGLEEAQRTFLTASMVRGRRTAFANALARAKGHHIPDDAEPEQIEALLDDWIYTGYVDAGHVNPDLRCECGRPLRYQHRVKHKGTGETKKFGIEHLKEHLGIDAQAVAAIKRGFDAIDYELDELLLKVVQGWTPEPDLIAEGGLPLPDDIREHLALGLPLLERQVKRLRDRRMRAHAAKRLRLSAASAAGSPGAAAAAGAKPAGAGGSRQAEAIDLFDWIAGTASGPASAGEPAGPDVPDGPAPEELPPPLHAPVNAYLADGIRSVRVICELLIREHGAYAGRFVTGKPKLFVPVCDYIERTYPEAVVESRAGTDRLYSV